VSPRARCSRFVALDALEQGYAMLASRIVSHGHIGVLAVDFRTHTPYPAALHDIDNAVNWLHDHGASAVYLYGDSSGGSPGLDWT
jgi:acetyl esterase/lipase